MEARKGLEGQVQLSAVGQRGQSGKLALEAHAAQVTMSERSVQTEVGPYCAQRQMAQEGGGVGCGRQRPTDSKPEASSATLVSSHVSVRRQEKVKAPFEEHWDPCGRSEVWAVVSTAAHGGVRDRRMAASRSMGVG